MTACPAAAKTGCLQRHCWLPTAALPAAALLAACNNTACNGGTAGCLQQHCLQQWHCWLLAALPAQLVPGRLQQRQPTWLPAAVCPGLPAVLIARKYTGVVV